jgi:hypothetical protein
MSPLATLPAEVVPKLAKLVRAVQRYEKFNAAGAKAIDAAIAAKAEMFAALREIEVSEPPADPAPPPHSSNGGDLAAKPGELLLGRAEPAPEYWWQNL